MAIFFLYSDRNYVSVHTITRDEFYGITPGTGTDTARHISVPILTGTVEEVRVATFAAPQTLTSTYSMTRAEADAFSTVSLSDHFKDISPSAYLRSLLTGTTGDTYKGDKAIPLLPGQTPTDVPHIHVVLTRLVAKVDLQYDLQAAYEGNTLAKPSMSAITFHGLDRGYFFKTDASAAGLTYTETLSSRISELNGRVYFYALPGAKNQLEFTVDYGSDKGKKQWTATFNSALTPASWHKIHLTVSGSQIDGDNTTITLGQSEQP